MCAVMCLITVGKYCCGICWVKGVSIIGREWSQRKGYNASSDTQNSSHSDESPLLPGMPKLSKKGRKAAETWRRQETQGRGDPAIWGKKPNSIQDGNGRGAGVGKASAAPPLALSCPLKEGGSKKKALQHQPVVPRGSPIHPHLAHLSGPSLPSRLCLEHGGLAQPNLLYTQVAISSSEQGHPLARQMWLERVMRKCQERWAEKWSHLIRDAFQLEPLKIRASQPRAILPLPPTREHWAMSGDTFCCHSLGWGCCWFLASF